MFTHSPVIDPPLGSPAETSTPSSPTSTLQSRGSRLRSLSFLRNYAHHLTNRDHSTVANLFPGASNTTSNTGNGNAIDSSSSSSSPTRASHSRRISRSMSTPSRSAVPPVLSPPERSTPPVIHTTIASPTAVTSVPGARLTQASSVPQGPTLSNVVESAIESDAESPVIVSHNVSPAASSLHMTSTESSAPAAPSVFSNPLVDPSPALEPTESTPANMDSPQQPAAESADQATRSSESVIPPQYSIRLTSYLDPRANRQSLPFPTVMRKLPTGNEVIRVGRFSERENGGLIPSNVPSAAPIGFKSKVVSRRHCEFWCENGKWFLKDVKSSSGTFLNHVRLSQPGQESRPYRIKDGDVVQLGIDFRGGEEMIFRCVKMRVEVNRGWQNSANPFNTSAHERIRNLTKPNTSSANSQDCTICLGRIAPCQTLFVAPCSHTWHYKCVKQLIDSPQYPIFMCPNCRATTDLEAEPEEPEGWDMDADQPSPPPEEIAASADVAGTSTAVDTLAADSAQGSSSVAINAQVSPSPEPDMTMNGNSIQRENVPAPVPIPSPRTPSPGDQSGHPHDMVLTPRNHAGPWVLDGAPIISNGSLAPSSAVQ